MNKPIINGDGKLTINHPVVIIALLWMLLQGLGTVFNFVDKLSTHEEAQSARAQYSNGRTNEITPKDVLKEVENSRQMAVRERSDMMRLQERQLDVLLRIEAKLNTLEKSK